MREEMNLETRKRENILIVVCTVFEFQIPCCVLI